MTLGVVPCGLPSNSRPSRITTMQDRSGAEVQVVFGLP